MTSATLTADPSTSSPTAKALLKAGLTGGAIAAALNLALYGVARAAGVDFVARYDAHGDATALPFFMPAVASLVPSLFAALVMLGMSRILKSPAVPFAALSAVLALASLVGPAGLADASVATKVVLSAMHFVAAAAIVIPLFRAVRR
jgi:hypothetical protein